MLLLSAAQVDPCTRSSPDTTPVCLHGKAWADWEMDSGSQENQNLIAQSNRAESRPKSNAAPSAKATLAVLCLHNHLILPTWFLPMPASFFSFPRCN